MKIELSQDEISAIVSGLESTIYNYKRQRMVDALIERLTEEYHAENLRLITEDGK